MEPAFQRGDILFLDNSVRAVHVGDLVVFKIKDRDIPSVHRILKVHEKPNGTVELLTKGDSNRVDDRGLYSPGQLWLQREDIIGKAVGTMRYVGMVTIPLNDYPVLKYVLVGVTGLTKTYTCTHARFRTSKGRWSYTIIHTVSTALLIVPGSSLRTRVYFSNLLLSVDAYPPLLE
jgi:signal peptidase I